MFNDAGGIISALLVKRAKSQRVDDVLCVYELWILSKSTLHTL